MSPSTVSLVLNDASDRISADTIAKVRAAAQELGYRPDPAARTLRTRKTRTIGVVTDSILTTASAAGMVQGVQDVAWPHDHLLFWLGTDDDPLLFTRAVDALAARRVDGFLFAAMYHRRLHFSRRTAGIVSVGLDAVSDDPEAPCFVPDEFPAARAAVRLLVQQGHRRIAHISEPAGDGLARRLRLDGFRAALAESGLGEGQVVVPAWGRFGSRAVELAALDLLTGPERPTAVFAFNDISAMGVYHAARHLGLSIPHDVSVVGFDDYENVASQLFPALTTMALPHRRMGQDAATALLSGIGVIDAPAPSGVTRIECPLIERDSVAPPPG